jgi:hypothetical protein
MSSNGSRLARSLGVLLLVALWPACGRSPVGLEEDGGLQPDLPPTDTHVPDAKPADDPDTAPPVIPDGPCVATCVDLCKLLYGCGLYPKGPDACLADCPSWSAPTRACLEGVVCSYSNDCKAAMDCIASPPMADLIAKDLAAKVAGATVTYTFNACNKGKVPATTFGVALYHDSPTPPKPGQPGDQSVKVPPGLAPGTCAPLSLQRSQTPDGSYSSWVQVDVPGAVAESDEDNNVAGPVQVTVKVPPKPDLTIKQFDVQVNGSDIVYTAEVCNVGTGGSFFFRLEIYYSKALKPGAFALGDDNVTFLGGLAAGACKTVTRTYKNAPVGMYTSWAQVDALNTVAESDEGNNVAGPKLVAVTPESGCISLCTFATTCGLFTVTEFAQCLSWCNSMDSAARQCADAAAAAQSCSDLKSCQLPPPPPPPPPPWGCFTLCNYLINTCNLIPSNQYLTCVGGCYSLPSTKVQCAYNAMNNQQCLQMMLCIL